MISSFDLSGQPGKQAPAFVWQHDNDWVAKFVSQAGLAPSLATCRGDREDAAVFFPLHNTHLYLCKQISHKC